MSAESGQLAIRCTNCGRRWNPASVSASWSPCICGNSKYGTTVLLGDFPDGSKVAAEWQDMPDMPGESS